MEQVRYIPNIEAGSWGLSGGTTGPPTIANQATGTAVSIIGTIAAFDPEPFSKAAIMIGLALVSLFQKVFGIGNGCGQSCIQATEYANEAEPLLQQNLLNYVNQPIRSATMQSQALAIFDQTWTSLQQACATVAGSAGSNCIGDRQSGACKWKASPGQWVQNNDGSYKWQLWGGVGSGNSCFNWYSGYRDPISSDPGVIPDSQLLANSSSSSNAAISTIMGDISSNPSLLIGLIAAVVGGMFFFNE